MFKSNYFKPHVIVAVLTFAIQKAAWEVECFFRSVFMKQAKPISYYFPDTPTAIYYIQEGKRKYAHHPKFTLTESSHISRGTFVNTEGVITHYIDPALAAIMVATGKEPKLYDLNTPAESYGWNFNETRDILNALDSLSRGNSYYWNLYYGDISNVKIVKRKNSIIIVEDYPLFQNSK